MTQIHSLVLLRWLIHFHIDEGERDSPFDFDWISGYYCDIGLLLWLSLYISPMVENFLVLNIAHQFVWLDLHSFPVVWNCALLFVLFFNDFNSCSACTLGLESAPFLVYTSGAIRVSCSHSSCFSAIPLLEIITLVHSKILFYIAVFRFLANTSSGIPANLMWFLAE